MGGRIRKTLADRFWGRVTRGPRSACWLWTGGIGRDGYGKIHDAADRTLAAHRVAWELFHFPIPEGYLVIHACDTPRCVNPGHLLLGTHAANMRDMVAKGRARNGSDGYKLTRTEVLQIR